MAVVVTRRRGGLALPVVMLAALLFLAVLGAEARPLGGAGWELSGAGPLPSGGAFIVETIRRLYLQQLSGPGPSCQTYSPNNGCPP